MSLSEMKAQHKNRIQSLISIDIQSELNRMTTTRKCYDKLGTRKSDELSMNLNVN